MSEMRDRLIKAADDVARDANGPVSSEAIVDAFLAELSRPDGVLVEVGRASIWDRLGGGYEERWQAERAFTAMIDAIRDKPRTYLSLSDEVNAQLEPWVRAT